MIKVCPICICKPNMLRYIWRLKQKCIQLIRWSGFLFLSMGTYSKKLKIHCHLCQQNFVRFFSAPSSSSWQFIQNAFVHAVVGFELGWVIGFWGWSLAWFRAKYKAFKANRLIDGWIPMNWETALSSSKLLEKEWKDSWQSYFCLAHQASRLGTGTGTIINSTKWTFRITCA